MLILKIKNKLCYYTKKLLYFISSTVFSNSIQTRLGYSKNTKLLIIHADDMGLSGSANAATIESMIKGMVNSGSIMVPCPKFQEIANFARSHQEADLGIHLTLTSEWPLYKWPTILPADEVSSITDRDGFMLESTKELLKSAEVAEVEKELRAQLKVATESGIDLTHIDSHMFAAFSSQEILNIYIALGKEFRLPVLLTKDIYFRNHNIPNEILVDHLYCAEPEKYTIGLKNYYGQILKSLKPGLNCILIHPAFNDAEMQNITNHIINYGASWRQDDFDFFTSNDCRLILRNNNIQLITWREIRNKLVR